MTTKSRHKADRAKSPVLSIDQIHERYDAEWVAVADPQTTALHEVLAGRVICHSKDRDEVYRKMHESNARTIAILYTGGLPEDVVLCPSVFDVIEKDVDDVEAKP